MILAKGGAEKSPALKVRQAVIYLARAVDKVDRSL
jgi:hypothetical protein